MSDTHQKHTNLQKPILGNFSRNEIAILGTPCGEIKKLAKELIHHLGARYNVAYVDADHKFGDQAEGENLKQGFVSADSQLEFIDKIDFHQVNRKVRDNPIQMRKDFQDADLVIVNGNHFNASRQVLVLDPRKDLGKKLDKISKVQMILTGEGSLPPSVREHIQTLQDVDQIPTYSINDTLQIAESLDDMLTLQLPSIKGLVLAGGKSARMHQDKGLIDYYGKPQREHAADLLTPFCREVLISCRPDQLDEMKKPYRGLADTFVGLGPFGGILSAFRNDPNSAWLVVACDLPFLDNKTIANLIENRNPSKVATSYWDSDHTFPEPLITLWEPRAYSEMLFFLGSGYSCPRKVLINSDVELLEVPNINALTNVNLPSDLEEVRRVIQGVAQSAQ